MATREQTISKARDLGATEETIAALAAAARVACKASIALPASRLEGLSQGRGWCRLGRGDAARWGEREQGAYRVSAEGIWTVYGSDGFRREERREWAVRHVAVGPETWTVAS